VVFLAEAHPARLKINTAKKPKVRKYLGDIINVVAFVGAGFKTRPYRTNYHNFFLCLSLRSLFFLLCLAIFFLFLFLPQGITEPPFNVD